MKSAKTVNTELKFTNLPGEIITDNSPKSNSKRNLRIIFAVTSGVILALGALLVILSISKQHDVDVTESLFYMKNGTMYYTSIDKIAPVDIITPKEDTIQDTYSIYGFFTVKVSDDGSTLFYPDKIDLESPYFSADIYSYSLTSRNHKAKKIDSEINNYTINQDGSLIFL